MLTQQCTAMADGRTCIFPKGHHGEHYAPNDSADHSDQIRLRVVKDRVESQDRELAELRSELTECIGYLKAARTDRTALARAIDPRSETPAAERSTESLTAWADGERAQMAEARKQIIRHRDEIDKLDAEIAALGQRAEAAEAALAKIAARLSITPESDIALLLDVRLNRYERDSNISSAAELRRTVIELRDELATLRATQAADLTRVEERYDVLIRDLEERARKAAEDAVLVVRRLQEERDKLGLALVEAKRDTARLDAYEKFSVKGICPGRRYDSQFGFLYWEWSNEQYKTLREAIDAAMQADAPPACLFCPHPKHEGRCKGEAPNAQFSCSCDVCEHGRNRAYCKECACGKP